MVTMQSCDVSNIGLQQLSVAAIQHKQLKNGTGMQGSELSDAASKKKYLPLSHFVNESGHECADCPYSCAAATAILPAAGKFPVNDIDLQPCFCNKTHVASSDNIAVSYEPEILPAMIQYCNNRTTSVKKRKGLTITIPQRDSVAKESGTGMRQLSAAEEKQIDEAIELANSFARLNSSEHGLLTPHLASGSSKESLDSPAHNSGHAFRFTAFKKRTTTAAVASRDDKKTFLDGLVLTCDSAAIFTVDAQTAYNELVAMSPTAATSETMKTKLLTGRHYRTHRLLSDSPAPRPSLTRRLQRSSLSESDRRLVLPESLSATPTQIHHQDIFHRSVSLPKEQDVGADHQYHISLQSVSSSDVTLSPCDQLTGNTFGDNDPSVSCTHSSPPPLPPRIPLRPSTVNVRPRQRQYPLAVIQRPKPKSVSEVPQHDLHSYAVWDALLPRRMTRSTNDNVTLECHALSAESLKSELNSTKDSDDSVFSSDEIISAEIPAAQRASPPQHSFCNATQLGCSNDSAENVATCYEGLDSISYEDLMEFALDGPSNR